LGFFGPKNRQPRKRSIGALLFTIHDLLFTIYGIMQVSDGYCIRQIFIARNRFTQANLRPSAAVFVSGKWHSHCSDASRYLKQERRTGLKFTPAIPVTP
jgi:hypothetical protein